VSRTKLQIFLESNRFRYSILGVILFNAILLGLETVPPVMAVAGPLILALDTLCLGIFTTEILLKLYAFRWAFFKNGWNLFDFVIVGISLIPGSEGLSVLRALRVLRLLRVVSVAPSLKRVVEGLITALPGMGSVFLLMALIFYIGSVMATSIVRPVMEVYPYAWMFFLPFILVTTFAVVNLLVGLIVNSMQDAHHVEDNEKTDAYRDEIKERLENIEKMLRER